ncbi:unnamed protein product [Sympodiomycopsis kandeliae]
MDTTPRLGYSSGTPSRSADPPHPQQQQQQPPYYPEQGPPPAYSTALRKVYPYSLRPVLLVATLLSFLYLIIVAISSFRSTTWDHETGKLRLFDILIGALLLPAALIELFGFTAAWTCKLHFARLYSIASLFALGFTVTADVLAIVQHYTLSNDLITGCTLENTGRTGGSVYGWGGFFGNENGNNNSDVNLPWTTDQARSYCNAQWRRDGIWTIVWLVIILLVGTLFLSFAFTFVQQLRNPNSIRNFRNNTTNGTTTRQPASHQYTSAFTYDDDETSPFDNRGRYSYDQQQQHSYPPPQGVPPEYQGRKSGVFNSIDLDRKDPNIGQYQQQQENTLQRAESSRSAANRNSRRDSQDTLTDQNASAREQPDKTPQI